MPKGGKSKFLTAKKKAGSQDFVRKRAKVGKKVQRRVGETDASFTAKHVALGEQSVENRRAKYNLAEQLALFSHHADKSRAAACTTAQGMVQDLEWDTTAEDLAQLLDGAARLMSDTAARVRTAAVGLVEAIVGGSRDLAQRCDAVATASPIVAARLGVALASLDAGCRFDGATVLSAVLLAHGHTPATAALAPKMAAALFAPLVDALRVAPLPRDADGPKARSHVYRVALMRCLLVLLLFAEPLGEHQQAEENFARHLLGLPKVGIEARVTPSVDWSQGGGVVLMRAVSRPLARAPASTPGGEPSTAIGRDVAKVAHVVAQGAAARLGNAKTSRDVYAAAFSQLEWAAAILAVACAPLPSMDFSIDVTSVISKAKIDDIRLLAADRQPTPPAGGRH
ncbi:hypothetical protein M885DRAFT_543119 [Pelagophyceae sp. CCMP2097]|nr:hypothetical protein M885DRAFT_543119 [Pelagophyceae sp. CCMP2097]